MGMLCCKLKKDVNEDYEYGVRELQAIRQSTYTCHSANQNVDQEDIFLEFTCQSLLDVSCYLKGLEEKAPEVKPIYPPAPPPPVDLCNSDGFYCIALNM